MASIKLQKIVFFDEGKGQVKSGSATIVANNYSSDVRGKTTHPKIEALGRVLYLSKDRKSGIFYSVTRGVVEYDLLNDEFSEVSPDDERISHTDFRAELYNHVNFGNIYYFLAFASLQGYLELLRQTFWTENDAHGGQGIYEKALCHVMHTVMKNKALCACDEFYRTSLLSYITETIKPRELASDSSYFYDLGTRDFKLRFFRNYIRHMRKTNPSFGIGCYIDSTPLRGDAKFNPFNAFSSHGEDKPVKQTRLVLIIDRATGKPVWYEFICGNVLDMSTIEPVGRTLKISFDIDLKELVLDAGYAECPELYEKFNADEDLKEENEESARPVTTQAVDPAISAAEQEDKNLLIVRMPAKDDFPFAECYDSNKGILFDPVYEFVRGEHTYFGIRSEKPMTIKGHAEYCYTYLDKDQSLALNRSYRAKNPDRWNNLTDDEKRWLAVKDGFFVLISNSKLSAEAMLDLYFKRVDIEAVFKTGKEYLDILPVAKWNKERVEGKILNDMISLILYTDIRSAIAEFEIGVPRMLNQLTALECTRGIGENNDLIAVGTPSKQIKEYFSKLGVRICGHMNISQIKDVVLKGTTLEELELLAHKKVRKNKSSSAKITVRIPKTAEQRQKESEERKKLKAEEKKKAKQKGLQKQ